MEMKLEDGNTVPFVYYSPNQDTHRIPLGSLVEVKGSGLRLYVVEHRNSPFGSPLYNLYHDASYTKLLTEMGAKYTDETMDNLLAKIHIDTIMSRIRIGFLTGIKEEDLKLVWTDPMDPTLTITTDPL